MKNPPEHIHILEDGSILRHRHEHAHTKKVLNRINYSIGHLNGILKMIEEGRDCSEVLVQLSAVNASISKVRKIIIKDHMEHCIVDAVKSGDQKVLDDFLASMDKLFD